MQLVMVRILKLALIILLATTIKVYSQTNDSIVTHSAPDYESTTLRLYYEAKWDSLMKTGLTALEEGYKDFYIYVRTGAAAYYKGNYSLAAGLLEKADDLYRGDDYTNELLYYSYLYTARPQQALLVRKYMSGELKMKISKLTGQSVYLETGPIFTDGKKQADGHMKTDTISFSDKYSEKEAFYLVTGIRQPVNRWLWISGAFSSLDFTKHRDVQIKYWDTLAGDYRVRQSEYYFSPSFVLNKRMTFSPSLRITDTKVSEPIVSEDSITSLYLGLPVARNFNDYVAGGEILYASNYWKALTGGWFIRAGSIETWQVSGSVVLMPLGNLNLYTVSNITWKSIAAESPFVFSQSCGFKVYNRTWLEIAGTIGNVAATTEYNGQLLNNQINKSKYRLSSILLIDLTPKLRFSMRYQYMKNESMAWFLNPEYKLFEEPYTYNRHIITGGLTWNVN